jgi:hypothetical protein
MPTRRLAFDLEAALLDPGSTFAEPMDVVDDRTLPIETKMKLLQQWEIDARELAVAEEEGMTGGEESMLGRVRHALRRLGATEHPACTTQTTKHGGSRGDSDGSSIHKAPLRAAARGRRKRPRHENCRGRDYLRRTMSMQKLFPTTFRQEAAPMVAYANPSAAVYFRRTYNRPAGCH